ncbi:type II toxin-antitoxin system RatA family toxin [Salinigranum halophilum]|uniref:type II toxin-antitoxin system RatA family toxin n=1 Tax=Salinigranum halophilum TaxID=2565931 RepID=UPI0010A87683|nr:SRPBCC family protein [Salinigranum halophilum]
MTTISMHRTVDAPRTVVWDVITDHELYGDVAPNLSSVSVVEGKGEGLIRRCVDTDGNEWTESCTHWEACQSYAVSVHVENSVFHRRFFTRMDGEWRLSEHDDGVRITITFDFDPRYGPLDVFISKYFEYKAPGLIEAIFDDWEDEIRSRTLDETETDTDENHTNRGVNALYR